MKNLQLLFVTLFLCISGAQAQTIVDSLVAPDRIEKVYLHTDRPFYYPGETLWFKSYITNAHQQVTHMSDIVYVELISPEGNSIIKKQYSINQGASYGQFEFKKAWVGGIYTVKAYTTWMLNNGEENIFSKKVTVQKVVQPRLQMKFDFQKEAYGPGSTVTATLELKDLENNPLKNKTCTLTLNINGKENFKKTFVSDSNGDVFLDFVLPATLTTTDAVVNVIIEHQGNPESISRAVPVILDSIDLQLLPESGVLLEGHKNNIAFKALNAYGKPADISGVVKNNLGEIVTNFDSYHNGMGSFNLTPKTGEIYTAHILTPFVSKKSYVVPRAAKKGMSLHLESTNERYATFSINSSEDMKVELCASDVQQTLYNKTIRTQKGVRQVHVPLALFSQGIAKFTLQTEDGSYVAERLVFLHYNRPLDIEICSDKEVYGTREKVNVTITTKNYAGDPVPSNLSVAVVDNKLLSFADDRQDNITSYLLMSSELKGSIYKPNFYFNPKEIKAQKALDYVLLTHGWRSYLTEENINILEAKYAPERLSIHSGQIRDKQGKPAVAKLLLFDRNGTKVLPFQTDENGRFMFKLENGRSCMLLAYNDKAEKLTIVRDIGPNTAPWTARREQRLKAQEAEKVLENNRDKLARPNAKPIKEKVVSGKPKVATSVSLEADSVLESVVVTAQGIRREKKALGYAITEVNADEIGLAAEADIGRVLSGKASGVAITSQSGSSGSASKVVIRGYSSVTGNNQPLFVVDGFPITADGNYNSGSVLDVDPANVESVQVLKGLAAATLYGTAGRNGVIVIQTKNNQYRYRSSNNYLNNRKYKNYTTESYYNYNHRTYATSKNFYAPVYDSQDLSSERFDFRQTIYWNPVVQTDKNGQATLSYYNSDAVTSFNITAEGIGAQGQVGRKEKNYSVTKPLEVDFKMPAYMSLNDEVVLPITVRNNTETDLKGTIKIDLPQGITLVSIGKTTNLKNTETRIGIPAKGFKVIPVTITPKEQLAIADIRIIVLGEEHSDFLHKTTEIVSPYFPTQAAIAGFESADYSFTINNAVPKSLTAEFNLYTDIIGDVMDGIESLIRQPYGCFEQTSSSTYPNVMVLKYLKESGKSNTDIEQKAMDYIKTGYKRLISFETTEGGFEWFGKTPPHETLTAFGVLEFTEMKEVYPKVSQSMIDRTVRWLMSRRDGQGGFHKSKKGYDSFASSPQDVANAYIVYALSASKVEVDIENEYQMAFNDALKSKDGYKMALMACAAAELNKSGDVQRLIDEIKKNIDTHGLNELPVVNTITRSYGQDKQTETLAFTILALLNEQMQDQVLITRAIEQLVANRKNGRFGSTQSTAMALKALIEYTKNQKAKIIASNDAVNLTINGNSLSQKLTTTTTGKIQIKNLEGYLKNGNNSITVSFLNPKLKFPYSLDVYWDSTLPQSAKERPLEMTTTVDIVAKVGETIRYTTKVTNMSKDGLGMVTAVVGLPSGASAQPWQLKELIETKKVAFYEVFDNYVVFYWRSFEKNETKIVHLDLKAEIAGTYTAPASSVYPYYGEEFKLWKSGVEVTIQ